MKHCAPIQNQLRRAVAAPVVSGFLVGSALAVGGCTVPEPMYPQLPPADGTRTGLVVLVHGSGDTPEDWPMELAEVMEDGLAAPLDWDLWLYDWEEDADQRLVAAELGILHGRYLGEALLAETDYTQLHLVGHSVGAFVVHGVELYFSDSQSPVPIVHSTYLDAFGGRGSDWDYGQRNFGAAADFSDSYFNRSDPVPSTNGLLDQAHNFDVTQVRPQGLGAREGHWWPVSFYADAGQGEAVGLGLTAEVAGADVLDLHLAWPRGAETVLP